MSRAHLFSTIKLSCPVCKTKEMVKVRTPKLLEVRTAPLECKVCDSRWLARIKKNQNFGHKDAPGPTAMVTYTNIFLSDAAKELIAEERATAGTSPAATAPQPAKEQP
jgi:hypothetical protein